MSFASSLLSADEREELVRASAVRTGRAFVSHDFDATHSKSLRDILNEIRESCSILAYTGIAWRAVDDYAS